MLFNNDRNAMREVYYQSWQKKLKGETLNPTEAIISTVITEHPEYHKIFDKKQNHIDKDFSPESGQTNPFLHMGLHIAIREQLATNRPFGIKGIYLELMNKYQDNSTVEHMMMDHLVETMMASQRTGLPPNEQNYLQSLRQLLSQI